MGDAPYRPLHREVPRRPEPPPRVVPFGLRAKLRTGGVFGYIGWGIMCFSSIFVWVFVVPSELVTMLEFRGELAYADATITSVSPTSMSENDATVLAIDFEFVDHAGREQSGSSYSLGRHPPVGSVHRAEYPLDDPTESRLVGYRARPWSAWVAFVLIFPAIGLGFVLVAWVRARKAIRLLRIGVVAEGKLVSSRATNTRINNNFVYEYSFEFEVAGRKHTATGKTHGGELTDDELEPLLYDPRWPGNATMLDHLPGAPKIGEDGELVHTWGAAAATALVLPGLFLLMNSVAWLIYTA